MSIIASVNKKIIVLLVVVILVFVSIWIFIEYYSVQKEKRPTSISTLVPSTTTVQETKIYQNTEWGFEFQYPQDWVVEKNYSTNYYSQFNLRIMPINEKHTKLPVIINIVLPEFAERSFGSLEKTVSEVTIDGVSGIKYEYEFGGRQEIAIILPLGDLRMIIGTDDKQYNTEMFDQIVSTFKFLK